jgi:hypothetical protein
MCLGNDRIVSRQMAESQNEVLKLQLTSLKALTPELINPVLEENRIHLYTEGPTRIRKRHNYSSICAKKNLSDEINQCQLLERGPNVYSDIGLSNVANHAGKYCLAEDTLKAAFNRLYRTEIFSPTPLLCVRRKSNHLEWSCRILAKICTPTIGSEL